MNTNQANHFKVLCVKMQGLIRQSLNIDPYHFAAPVAPVFTMPLANQKAKEGQPTQLDARVSGVPEPEVAWMKDDHPVRTGERIHAEKEGDLHSLKISEVDIEDEGTYMCQARNTAGTATSMADLNVECK